MQTARKTGRPMQKLKRKATITEMLFVLFGIIISLIIFASPMEAGVKWLFNLPGPGERSFNTMFDLSNKIGGMAQNSMEAMQLMIEEESIIAAFAKNSPKIIFDDGSYIVEFERPDSCTAGKACLCYCKGGVEAEATKMSFSMVGFGAPGAGNYKITCKQDKLSCKTLDSIDYPSLIDKQTFGSDVARRYQLKGGLLFGPGPESTVYVEKNKGDIVGICYVRPCVTA